MIKFVFSFFLLLSSVSFAQSNNDSVTLNFERVPVIQLLKATYHNMLGLNYIIDPSLSGDSRAISVNIKSLPKDKIKTTIDSLLEQSGISIKHISDIPYFYPSNNQVKSNPIDDLSNFSSAPNSPSPVLNTAFTEDLQSSSKDTEFYDPRYRLSDHLQTLANSLLSTQYAPSDKVILTGSPEQIKKVRSILESFDTLPPEIIAKALVFEFVDSKADGSTFQLAMNVLSSKLSLGIGSSPSRLESFLRFKNQTIDAVLSAVSGDSRFKLHSAPSIRVKDGSKGRIVVGSDVPVLAESQTDKNGNPVQSVQYRSSGVIFDLQPRVMRDRIEVNLSQQLSNFQSTSTSSINSPTLTKREVSTTIGIESGDLIVLGGLDEVKQSDSRKGLPFLPRSLDSVNSEYTKSQILVVLQITRLPSSSIHD